IIVKFTTKSFYNRLIKFHQVTKILYRNNYFLAKLKLTYFHKFENTTEALCATTALVRSQWDSLISGVTEKERTAMTLGLVHSLSSTARMMALASNLTILVSDLISARLISKTGSLTSLAKHPASTLQILGAEKALFCALKSKNTLKYGLIYHSHLVGQSSNKNKDKISRMLVAKESLATRVDALRDTASFELGAEHKVKLEIRLRMLEKGNICQISGTTKAKAKFEKYQVKNEYMQYSTSINSTLTTKKRPLIEEIETKENEMLKKKKKKYSTSSEQIKEEMKEEESQMEIESVTVSKRKKHRKKNIV
ncbi:NOP58 protein, partial [Acromyrmex insinuator]